MARMASVSDGSVCRTSPIEEVLTINTRIRYPSSLNSNALSSSDALRRDVDQALMIAFCGIAFTHLVVAGD